MLPDLPKIRKEKEADFGLDLRKWLVKTPQKTCGYEIKDSRGKNYISFREIKNEQLANGMAIKSKKGVLVRVQGTNGESDYIYLREEPAYIVVKYPKCFCIIDVETLILEKTRSKRKSLTVERAERLSIKTIKCK